MLQPLAMLLAISGLLFVLWRITKGSHIVLRGIVLGQTIFWALSFVLRPLTLIFVQPAPNFGDGVADSRLLFFDSNYALAVTTLSKIVLVSFLTYTITMYVILHNDRVRTKNNGAHQFSFARHMPRMRIPFSLIILFELIGLTCEVLVANHDSSIVVKSCAVLGRFSTIIFFLYSQFDRKSTSGKVQIAFVSICAALDSYLIASKNPIFGLIFFAGIFIAQQGLPSKKLKIWILPASVAGFFVFNLIQDLKGSLAENLVKSAVSDRYPIPFSSLYPILLRFDLFRSLTDAYFAGPGSWYSVSDYAKKILIGPVPQLWGSGRTNGQLWAIEVSGKTISGRGRTGVSLAQGLPAEGWIINGYFGVAVISALAAIFTFTVAWSMSKGLTVLSGILAYSVVSNSIFEQGLIGIAETLNSGLKATVIAYPLIWLSNRPEFVRRKNHSFQNLNFNSETKGDTISIPCPTKSSSRL
jgi:hypothetical protein